MKEFNRKGIIFSKEESDQIFQILEYSSFSIVEIKHSILTPENALKEHVLPCNAFLFTGSGRVKVILDDSSYRIQHFCLFHGHKDTKLSIFPYCDSLEYYMILYKTGDAQFHKKELKNLLQYIDPFQQVYGFTPQNPVLITALIANMYEHWQDSDSQMKFYEKSLFYQMLYEVYKELAQVNALAYDSDIVGITLRYLEENYSHHISVQNICQKIGISYSHFYRLFKRETGGSFQNCLLKIRLEKASHYILEGNYTLSEIAKLTGFYDEFHLSSSFKKLTGISPVAYRKILTWNKKYDYMETFNASYYNETCQVSNGEPNLEGAYQMFNHFKNKAALAAALSLTTLFTACSVQTSNTDGGTSNASQPTSSPSTAAASEDAANAETITLSTVKGDVEIPANPQRVITDSRLLGDVVALGVIPTAIEDYGSVDVAYKDLIKDITILEKWEPEFIMAEQPDLIITLYEENYEQLSKIAPTIYVPVDSLTIEEKLSFIAEGLGKAPEEGKKLVTDFYEKVDAYKVKLKDAGLYDKTFSVIRIQGENQIGVRWSNNLGGQILFGALELPMTELALKEINSGQDWGATLSFETLPDYMGDYILVTEYDDNYGLIEDNPVWTSLSAVQAGNIMRFQEPFMYQNDIYSWSVQLELIANALLDLAK